MLHRIFSLSVRSAENRDSSVLGEREAVVVVVVSVSLFKFHVMAAAFRIHAWLPHIMPLQIANSVSSLASVLHNKRGRAPA